MIILTAKVIKSELKEFFKETTDENGVKTKELFKKVNRIECKVKQIEKNIFIDIEDKEENEKIFNTDYTSKVIRADIYLDNYNDLNTDFEKRFYKLTKQNINILSGDKIPEKLKGNYRKAYINGDLNNTFKNEYVGSFKIGQVKDYTNKQKPVLNGYKLELEITNDKLKTKKLTIKGFSTTQQELANKLGNKLLDKEIDFNYVNTTTVNGVRHSIEYKDLVKHIKNYKELIK
jgi:hypothetical protein